jgi:hypothetical protein
VRSCPPHPAYFEYLYLSIGITAACAAVLFLVGLTLVGTLLLLVVAAEVVGVVVYRRRADRR